MESLPHAEGQALTVTPKSDASLSGIRGAYLVLPCPELEPTLRFFVERLGFAVEVISPADEPRFAVVSGHGVRLGLDPDAPQSPGELVLRCDDPSMLGGEVLTAPNGTQVRLIHAEPPLVLPPLAPSLVVSKSNDATAWITGRAGMQYRDLIPNRQGGRFIASHIRIAEGGPVPDYVHHHHIRFQLIYCHRGWVELVYEDQGPAFVIEPGDAVLQPPHIRHQVLACSPGLEVIEISSPAIHDTFGDLEMTLPTPHERPDRLFGGQRFVHHQVAQATWAPWRVQGWRSRDLGIASATQRLASVQVAIPTKGDSTEMEFHEGELRFMYVLAGAVDLAIAERPKEHLVSDDCVTVPPGMPHALLDPSPDLQLLEVALPANSTR